MYQSDNILSGPGLNLATPLILTHALLWESLYIKWGYIKMYVR
jgi:hypothetical protein